MWIDAGLDEIAKGGIDRVRVEVLAQRLGVTKGGFYRRFRDRRALLDAMLEAWKVGRIAAIEQQTDPGDLTADERLKSIISLFASRVNAQGMAIELAVREWARADAAAAAAVLEVDAARMINVTRLYEEMGSANGQAQARAVLFYAFIFGQGLLFLDPSPAKRAQLIEGCTELLTGAA